MAAGKTIAQELMESIALQTRRRLPAYISPSDAVSVQDYSRSPFAEWYVLDTVNLYWPGRTNRSHVYDIFAEYMPHQDSCKTRLDMINFVSENRERYALDCHIVLKMHELNLNAWACRMSYYENGADELAIHAMSEMANVHTIILTRSKPWTTLDSAIQCTSISQLMDLCNVKLVYLGNNEFGRLRKRPANCTNPLVVNLPVFPSPEVPSERELETAESLLMMNQQTECVMELEEPVVSPKAQTSMLPKDHTLFLIDAMEHVIGHPIFEILVLKRLHRKDAMDLICEDPVYSDAMEHIIEKELPPDMQSDNLSQDVMDVLVETNTEYVLITPAVNLQMKNCSVRLTRIDNELSYVPTNKLCNVLNPPHRPHTRSQCAPKPVPSRRRPRRAHTSNSYCEPELTSEEESKPKREKHIPGSLGPSEDRILAQNQQTVQPSQRLPPSKSTSSDSTIESDGAPQASSSPSDAETELYDPESDTEKPKARGRFIITTKKLVKTKKKQCKYCEFVCDSAEALYAHHQKNHKILYCKLCNKAFNNKVTYSRHIKSHGDTGHVCTLCGKRFAYASLLKTHQSVHSDETHKCTHDDCEKSFKNKGDLTRHLKQHTAKMHECPDCNYANADLRNFQSHRFKHSQITQYVCEFCGEEFVFNTQYRRHLNDLKCKPKGSSSPEY